MVSFVQLAQVFFEQFLPVSSVELAEVSSEQLALRFSVAVWPLVWLLVVIFLCSCQVSEMFPLYLDLGLC